MNVVEHPNYSTVQKRNSLATRRPSSINLNRYSPPKHCAWVNWVGIVCVETYLLCSGIHAYAYRRTRLWLETQLLWHRTHVAWRLYHPLRLPRRHHKSLPKSFPSQPTPFKPPNPVTY